VASGRGHDRAHGSGDGLSLPALSPWPSAGWYTACLSEAVRHRPSDQHDPCCPVNKQESCSNTLKMSCLQRPLAERNRTSYERVPVHGVATEGKDFSHLLISLGPSPTEFPGVATRRVGGPCRYTVLRLGGSCSFAQLLPPGSKPSGHVLEAVKNGCAVDIQASSNQPETTARAGFT